MNPDIEEKTLDVSEQINLFYDFFNEYLLNNILELSSTDKESLFVDFSLLSKFNIQLSELLLNYPSEIIKAAELALSKLDVSKKIHLRFYNLPKSQIIPIKNIRSRHIGKFVSVMGVIRQKSGVKPLIISARFECPSCGNIMNITQDEHMFKQPTRCSCGRKGKFRLIEKELIDAQRIVIEESHESLDSGSQPKRFPIFLKYDLSSPWTDQRTNPGTRVVVNGIIDEQPLPAKGGGGSTTSELVIEGNYIEPLEEDFSDIKVSEEEFEEIKKLANDPGVFGKLRESIAPTIYGHELIKDALTLQIFGGVRKVRDDGVVTRGDTHILLIGDPGTGKCVSGETKIVLSDGTITSFCDLEKEHSFGLSEWIPHNRQVVSFDLNCKSSERNATKLWKRKCSERMFLLQTLSGRELKLTENHPLFTTYGGFVYGEEVSKLKAGDFIAVPRKISIDGSLQFLPLEIKRAKAHHKNTLTVPQVFDADIARLFAYIISEGYAAFTKSSGILSFNNNDVSLIEDFRRIIKTKFKIPVHERKKKNTFEIYVTSKEMLYFLDSIDPSLLQRSHAKKIPEIIQRSPNYILKSFISSLFECDGYISKRFEISYTSKSKALIEQLQILLLRFGIHSHIKKQLKFATNTKNKVKNEYYFLRIYGEFASIFMDKIGFVSDRKNKRLSNIKKHNTNVDIVPGVSKILKVLRIKYNLSQSEFQIPRSSYQHYEIGDRNPSRKNLAKIAEIYNKINSKDVFVQALHKLSNSDLLWDRILEIKEIEHEEYVYDFEVEKTHNFIANGVMIHNSQLIKRLSKVAPKARFVSGKGVSGAGLTASVIRDEFTGTWTLEAGALVLANKGYLMIDEMDKMNKEDRDAMHEGLEQQSISVSKANIQATLRCETTVLAAANPKFGRFDPYQTIAEQIDMPPSLISRFDLIFAVKDLPDKEKDTLMAEFILRLHQSSTIPHKIQVPISTELLRKYVAYSKQNINPILTDQALIAIQNEYVELRNSSSNESVKSVSITSRQLEGIIRLAEASARVRLSKEVTIDDAKRAISLVVHTLQEIAMDKETGRIDIDKITSGISASSRSKIVIVKEIILELEEKIGKIIPIDDIIQEAERKGITADKVEEALERLKRSGDIFEPKVNFISRL